MIAQKRKGPCEPAPRGPITNMMAVAVVPVLMLMVAFSANALTLDQALRGSVQSTNPTDYKTLQGGPI